MQELRTIHKIFKEAINKDPTEGINDVARHNINFLNNDESVDELRGEIVPDTTLNAIDVVLDCPVLHQEKIIDYLGGGLYGNVFKLGNDHALKLYQEEHSEMANDFFFNLETKKFEDVKGPEELFVYEVGEGERHGFSWREVPLIIPFRHYFEEEQGRGSKVKPYEASIIFFDDIINTIDELLSSKVIKHKNPKDRSSYDENQMRMMRIYGNFLRAKTGAEMKKLILLWEYVLWDGDKTEVASMKEKLDLFSDEDFAGLVKAILFVWKQGIELSMADFHDGNIGKLVGSNHWVVFDL
jgi:hypothetical protein